MRPLRAFLYSIAAVLTLLVFWTCSRADQPASTAPPDSPRTSVSAVADPVIAAVGDMVCGAGVPTSATCKHAETAALIGAIGPTAVLLLGDLQYENATLTDFNTYFEPTWGVYKSITAPAAGNHEYQTAGAKGYFDYFNGVGVQSGRAGDRSKGYYSFNIGAWHIIAINSNCASVGGCGAGSPQEQWLRADLAANPTRARSRTGTIRGSAPARTGTTRRCRRSGRRCTTIALTSCLLVTTTITSGSVRRLRRVSPTRPRGCARSSSAPVGKRSGDSRRSAPTASVATTPRSACSS